MSQEQKTLEYFNGNQLSADVAVKKYLMPRDSTPDDMHRENAKLYALMESRYPNPVSEEKLYKAFKDFKRLSPQGSILAMLRRTLGDLANLPYDRETAQIGSISNCFVIASPVDSYGGILQTDEELVQLSKRRCGVGFDISNLRPKSAIVRNSAQTSDGISIFMERYSHSTREVAQSGRRGALMLMIDCRHPEVETFITIKRDNGPDNPHSRVTGANISVRWHDDFLRAVEADSEYTLRWPVEASIEDAEITKVVRAREVFDMFAQCAWKSAEPGASFWTTALRESVADCYAINGYQTIATNPCFHRDTLIHTHQGHVRIEELVGRAVEVWNGYAWVVCDNFRVTGHNQPMVRVTMRDGSYEVVTHYHKAILSDGSRVSALKLKPGDRLRLSNAPGSRLDDLLSQTSDAARIMELQSLARTVDSVEDAGVEAEVFCGTSPSTSSLALSSGIQWGNCGEILLSAYDSCRLSILNLMGFVIDPFLPTARFDFDTFREYARLQQRLMDDTVDLELEAIGRILAKIEADPEDTEVKFREKRLWEKAQEACRNGRRTGGGLTALGDCLAALGIPYGSKRGIQAAEEIHKTAACEYEAESIQLAKERGAFPVWSWEAERNNPFLLRIMEARPDLIEDWKRYGRRNICNGTSAPVGTMSLECMVSESPRLFGTTSGIEPVALALETTRKRKVPHGEPHDLVDEQGDHWVKYTVSHAGLEAWRAATGKTDARESPYWGQTSSEIDPMFSVEIQAAAQRWIGHSISKTCVLPSDVKWETVRDLYLHAWKSGCKGFTVYRDGSLFGVIEAKDGRPTQIRDNAGAKRPSALQAKLHTLTVNRKRWTVVVSLLEGRPYEVFLKRGHFDVLDAGTVTKTDDKAFSFTDADGNALSLSDPTARDDFSGLARTASLALRHGVPVHYLCEQLEKATNLTDDSALALMRALKLHISTTAKPASVKTCPSCGGTDMAYQQGCVTCSNCGWSKCS